MSRIFLEKREMTRARMDRLMASASTVFATLMQDHHRSDYTNDSWVARCERTMKDAAAVAVGLEQNILDYVDEYEAEPNPLPKPAGTR